MISLYLTIKFVFMTKRPYEKDFNGVITSKKEYCENEMDVAEGLIHLKYSQPFILNYNFNQNTGINIINNTQEVTKDEFSVALSTNSKVYDKNNLEEDSKRIKLESLSRSLTNKNLDANANNYSKFIELQSLHDNNIHKNDFTHFKNRFLYIDTYKSSLLDLVVNYERKVYFNLTMLFILFFNVGKQRTRKIFSDFSFINNKKITHLIFKVKKSYYYDMNTPKISSQKQIYINKTVDEDFFNLQKYAGEFFMFLKPQTSAITRYYLIYFNYLIDFYGINVDTKNKNDFIAYAIKDFIDFEKNPFLKFLFPEFESFLKHFMINEEIYFCSRFHFLLSAFHFMYIYLKETFKKEIMSLLRNNEKIEILKCKNLFNFVLNTKIKFMVLLFRYISKYVDEIKRIILANISWLYKFKDLQNLNRVDFDTYFLLNLNKLKELENIIEYVFSPKLQKTNLYSSFYIKINKIPKNDELNKYFDKKENYKILIERIDKIMLKNNQEINFSDFSEEELKNIFYFKLTEMVKKEFD